MPDVDRRASTAFAERTTQGLYTLSENQIRVLTLEASVIYHEALTRGCSVQEAEIIRLRKLRETLERLPKI